MFDVFIIQKIREEEERRNRRETERPRVEMPIPEVPDEAVVEAEPKERRGVLIIEGDEE